MPNTMSTKKDMNIGLFIPCYADALDHLGQRNHEIKPDAAVHGFSRLIRSLKGE